MSQHVEGLVHEVPVHEGFFQPIQEMLSDFVSPNFRLVQDSATTVKVDAGTGDEQVSIAIDGKYRYITADVSTAIPAGDATRDVYVTGSDNDFTGPVESPDDTVYAFGLAIRAQGSPPATAIYRKVGEVEVESGAIVALYPLAGAGAGRYRRLVRASSNLALTDTLQDVPGLSIALRAVGLYCVRFGLNAGVVAASPTNLGVAADVVDGSGNDLFTPSSVVTSVSSQTEHSSVLSGEGDVEVASLPFTVKVRAERQGSATSGIVSRSPATFLSVERVA